MSNTRIHREKETVAKMIALYCHKMHGQGGDKLCEQCQELEKYAIYRLSKCPFQEGKTTCGQCQIHCYKPKMRKEIQQVMRIAGPMMLFRHPVLALGHFFDGLRKKPVHSSHGNK